MSIKGKSLKVKEYLYRGIEAAGRFRRKISGQITKQHISPVSGLAVQQLIALTGHATRVVNATVKEGMARKYKTERIHASTLGEYYKKHKYIPPEIYRQLGELIGFLYKNGLAHGDLIRRNLLIGEKNGKPWLYLIDFETAGLTDKKRTLYQVKNNKIEKRFTADSLGLFNKKTLEREISVASSTMLGKNKEDLRKQFTKGVYSEIFNPDPLVFRGKSIFDYPAIPGIKDIKKK